MLALIQSSIFYGQKLHYENSENASKMYNNGNYQRAKELYRDIYKKDLTNTKNKYYLAVCMVYSYEREDAISHLESLIGKNGIDNEVNYHIARAYHLENKYDKAISYYKKYIAKGGNDDFVSKSKRNITMCTNALELLKRPINVSFENLGSNINSKGEDYLAYISPDESMLFFTTRREGTTGRIYDLEGYYPSDIYSSEYKYWKWKKARSINYPNSYGNEATAGMSEDGNSIFFYVNNPESKNNIQVAIKGKRSFKRSEKIKDDNINNNSSEQISAALSANGDFLIFSSNREGGHGGHDLYISKKLPNGKWGTPTNMGKTINTPFDDCYPNLRKNGTELYFASKGHNSIGGFDVFKSRLDISKGEYEKPINIGYPLNTADDNLNISYTENGKYAYLSTYRNDSEGGLDIYKVDFIDETPQYTTVKGKVLKPDSTTFKIPLNIEVFKKEDNELYGIYQVNKESGNFIMILPPGKYEVNIDIPNEGYFKKNFAVVGRNKYKAEINRNIVVSFENSESKQQ